MQLMNALCHSRLLISAFQKRKTLYDTHPQPQSSMRYLAGEKDFFNYIQSEEDQDIYIILAGFFYIQKS